MNETSPPTILNIGCGPRPMDDAINLDSRPHPGVDEVFDLELSPDLASPLITRPQAIYGSLHLRVSP